MNNSTLPLDNLLLKDLPRPAFLDEFNPIGQIIGRVVPPFWYAVGFLGNPISAMVWLEQRMRRNNSSAIYLGALAISDLLFLFLHLLMTLHTVWGYNVYNDYVICEIFNFVYFVPQYLSTLLVLGFTAERYVAVCHPFLKEKLCTAKRAVVVIVCLTLVSITLSSAQVYIWTFGTNESTCIIRHEAEENGDESFFMIWTLVSDILAFGIVPLIVLGFNILVLKEIFKISRNDLMIRQQNRSGNSTASTVTLLCVSFFLIITQLSATIVYCMQRAFPPGDFLLRVNEARNDRTWANFFTYLEVRKVIEVLCLSHFACYFFIYCLTGKHFRKEVLLFLTLDGRIQFLNSVVSRRRRKEYYSMVSTNGGPMSETCPTANSTAI